MNARGAGVLFLTKSRRAFFKKMFRPSIFLDKLVRATPAVARKSLKSFARLSRYISPRGWNGSCETAFLINRLFAAREQRRKSFRHRSSLSSVSGRGFE
jgi:hypothetical protein